jgi:hypothetical protein
MFPDFWVNFLNENDLHGATVELSEELDVSGLGVDLQFLTTDQSIDEATNCWPGLGVSNDGYVPIGSCLHGSGDYYYIRSNDGQAGPLYRIYHDAVHDTGYEPDDAIVIVMQSYDDLLGFVGKRLS